MRRPQDFGEAAQTSRSRYPDLALQQPEGVHKHSVQARSMMLHPGSVLFLQLAD